MKIYLAFNLNDVTLIWNEVQDQYSTHKSFKNLPGTIFSHDSDHTKPKITNWVNKKVVSFVFIIRLVWIGFRADFPKLVKAANRLENRKKLTNFQSRKLSIPSIIDFDKKIITKWQNSSFPQPINHTVLFNTFWTNFCL